MAKLLQSWRPRDNAAAFYRFAVGTLGIEICKVT